MFHEFHVFYSQPPGVFRTFFSSVKVIYDYFCNQYSIPALNLTVVLVFYRP
jgi:hypothetical protein